MADWREEEGGVCLYTDFLAVSSPVVPYQPASVLALLATKSLLDWLAGWLAGWLAHLPTALS